MPRVAPVFFIPDELEYARMEVNRSYDFQVMLKALRQNDPELTTLRLQTLNSNEIVELYSVLLGNQVVIHLFLSTSMIDNKAAEGIALLIEKNCTLEVFDFNKNYKKFYNRFPYNTQELYLEQMLKPKLKEILGQSSLFSRRP